jgi:hypothetical protein
VPEAGLTPSPKEIALEKWAIQVCFHFAEPFLLDCILFNHRALSTQLDVSVRAFAVVVKNRRKPEKPSKTRGSVETRPDAADRNKFWPISCKTLDRPEVSLDIHRGELVMPKQFHVQAIETAPDGQSFAARELLPWADPYIASLMGRLQNEAEQGDWDFETRDETDLEDEDFLDDELPEDWHLDRAPVLPPVYGGWPLLNDLPAAPLLKD